VVRVSGYTTEMYCASCEVRTEFIYVCYVEESGPPLWSSGQSSWLQIGDVLCFLWGTNWIYTCYMEEGRSPLWSSGQSFWLHNADVLCFLWGTNWIYICYVEESRPPLWSSGQSSLLLFIPISPSVVPTRLSGTFKRGTYLRNILVTESKVTKSLKQNFTKEQDWTGC
jgi:hypothetical protein